MRSYSDHFTNLLFQKLIAHFLQWGLFGALSVQVCEYRTSALSACISNHNIICSDLYYLGLSNDPLYRKVLVYGVYAAELVQTILYAKMGFQEYAAGFGNIVALDEIGLFWFIAPILTAIGMYNYSFVDPLPLFYR